MERNIFVLIFVLILSFIGFVFSIDLSISNYGKIKDFFSGSIFADKVTKNFSEFSGSDKIVFNSKCFYYFDRSDVVLSIPCILKGEYPKLGFKESVDLAYPYIKGFSSKYEEFSTGFAYSGALPIFDNKLVDIKDYFSSYNTGLLLYLYSKGYIFRFDKSFLVKNTLKNYSYYVTDKRLDDRGACSKQNYLVAMSAIDRYLLEPGDVLDFNELLIGRKGYCGGKGYLFPQGVCGGSTQLFRNSLLNPFISVDKRYNHSNRYVKYYDEYIYGDDAAIYERIKKLIIRNIGSGSSYFRVFDFDGRKFLVNIYSKKSLYGVYVYKTQIGKLGASLGRNVFYRPTGEFWYNQHWSSNYSRKNYENN